MLAEERTLLTITELTNELAPAWDDYVRAAPGGLPLHLSGWRDVMRRTYGYDTRFLLARAGATVVGVLPLFSVPSRLTGRRLMTPPGGLCADDDWVAEALLERAWETAVAHHAKRLVLQDTRRAWPHTAGNWQTANHHVYWLVDLGDAEDALWKALDGNMRRQVRKARRSGLCAEVDRTGRLLDPFYTVFSHFTHKSGTPVFSRDFLANVIDTFPDGFNITVVWHAQTPIAGYFQLELDDTVYGMWGAALPEYLQLRPVYLAIWHMMADAIAAGYRYLDMGRSPVGSNASKYKGQWGGTAHPMYQQIRTAENNVTDTAVTQKVQSDSKFQLFMQLWPRLPLSLTRRLGPKLRWHIPFA